MLWEKKMTNEWIVGEHEWWNTELCKQILTIDISTVTIKITNKDKKFLLCVHFEYTKNEINKNWKSYSSISNKSGETSLLLFKNLNRWNCWVNERVIGVTTDCMLLEIFLCRNNIGLSQKKNLQWVGEVWKW